ncbi:MAG TPA: hypothetical protein PLK35_03400 [Candidatus Moranbacteria bacterium]|nr:hypothetical protein [Candidatus Moranbacteria bacterium]
MIKCNPTLEMGNRSGKEKEYDGCFGDCFLSIIFFFFILPLFYLLDLFFPQEKRRRRMGR